MKLETP